ncbi:hypothetical protein FKM82_012917 [Ascaphus truei]
MNCPPSPFWVEKYFLNTHLSPCCDQIFVYTKGNVQKRSTKLYLESKMKQNVLHLSAMQGPLAVGGIKQLTLTGTYSRCHSRPL